MEDIHKLQLLTDASFNYHSKPAKEIWFKAKSLTLTITESNLLIAALGMLEKAFKYDAHLESGGFVSISPSPLVPRYPWGRQQELTSQAISILEALSDKIMMREMGLDPRIYAYPELSGFPRVYSNDLEEEFEKHATSNSAEASHEETQGKRHVEDDDDSPP